MTAKYLSRVPADVVGMLRPLAVLTQAQVADILGVSTAAVQQAEARAIRKMRGHPLMLSLARQVGALPPPVAGPPRYRPAGRLADAGAPDAPPAAGSGGT